MRSAVAGLTMTALSHVSLVIGLGSSCSQPLFAKRPSRIDGSLRNAISRPGEVRLEPDAAGAGGVLVAFAAGDARVASGFSRTSSGVYAVFGITPSCSHRRQFASSFGSTFQNSRTRSYADRSGRSLIAAISSWADRPP